MSNKNKTNTAKQTTTSTKSTVSVVRDASGTVRAAQATAQVDDKAAKRAARAAERERERAARKAARAAMTPEQRRADRAKRRADKLPRLAATVGKLAKSIERVSKRLSGFATAIGERNDAGDVHVKHAADTISNALASARASMNACMSATADGWVPPVKSTGGQSSPIAIGSTVVLKSRVEARYAELMVDEPTGDLTVLKLTADKRAVVRTSSGNRFVVPARDLKLGE